MEINKGYGNDESTREQNSLSYSVWDTKSRIIMVPTHFTPHIKW